MTLAERLTRRGGPRKPPPDAEVVRSSMRMAGSEPQWGVGLAVLVVVAAVLNLTVTKGSGAPAHSSPLDSVLAIVLAAVLVPVSLRLRHRLAAPLVGIVAAFFVTLPKSPTILSVPHYVVLIAALAFALILSTRQRRLQRALAPQTTPARRRRRGEPDPEPAVKRPPRSKRYTPPKPPPKTRTGRR